MKAQSLGYLLGSVLIACSSLGTAPEVLADDRPFGFLRGDDDRSGLRDWLRSRRDDGPEAGSRVREWLRSRRDDGADDGPRWREWLRARGDDDRDRGRFWDRDRRDGWRDRWDRDDRDSPFAEFRRHWDDRDHRPWGRLPAVGYWLDDRYDDYRRYDDFYPRRYDRYRYDRYGYDPYRYGRAPYDYYDDYDGDFDEIGPWIALTVLGWKLLDNLNEDQQRRYESAVRHATTVPVGETVRWRSGSVGGAVTPVRERSAGPGRYCREFRHEVMIGSRKETAFGTACRMPDGSWEVQR